MIEKLEVLEDDADSPPQGRQVGVAQASNVSIEQMNETSRGLELQKQQPEKRRFTGPGRTSEEPETAAFQAERYVTKDLRPMSVS
jgi:hypothetical protein